MSNPVSPFPLTLLARHHAMYAFAKFLRVSGDYVDGASRRFPWRRRRGAAITFVGTRLLINVKMNVYIWEHKILRAEQIGDRYKVSVFQLSFQEARIERSPRIGRLPSFFCILTRLYNVSTAEVSWTSMIISALLFLNFSNCREFILYLLIFSENFWQKCVLNSTSRYRYAVSVPIWHYIPAFMPEQQ